MPPARADPARRRPLRDAVTSRLGGTTTTPLARTHQSLGFGVLREAAALAGDPAPRLLSGPEQDVILAELLAGHAAGATARPPWPPSARTSRCPPAPSAASCATCSCGPSSWVSTRRTSPRLGRQHGRAEWVARRRPARVRRGDGPLSPGAFDPAWILGAAADHLRGRPRRPRPAALALRLVVVDDAQELTAGPQRLLEVVVADGRVDLVPVGDPDAATQTFRGADPRLFSRLARRAPPCALATSYRGGGGAIAAARRVVGPSGVVGGARHREVSAGRARRRRRGAPAAHGGAGGRYVAGPLRAAHLLDGVPWSRMAVVVRGGAAPRPCAGCSWRRGARRHRRGRPARPRRGGRAAVPALLRCALDVVAGAEELDPADVVDVLTSPVGGADAVGCGGCAGRCAASSWTTGEVARATCSSPRPCCAVPPRPDRARGRSGPAGQPGARRRRARPAGGSGSRRSCGPCGARAGSPDRGATPRSAVAPAGGRADRDLDAVLGLFDAAARFVDRLPGASPPTSSTTSLGQDVAGDTSSPAPRGRVRRPGHPGGLRRPRVGPRRRRRGAGRRVARPAAARLAARLDRPRRRRDRPRGRRAAARAQVRHDETRLFHVAVTRARQRLVVTAVRSEDEQPSPYLDVVDPLADARPFTDVPRPLTLPGLVAELRRERWPGPRDPGRAVTALATLAREGVPGADPAQWWACATSPTTGPARPRRLRCGSHRRRSTSSAVRPAVGAAAAGGDGPSMGPRTSAPSCTRSPRPRRHRRRDLRRRARAPVGAAGPAAGLAQPARPRRARG